MEDEAADALEPIDAPKLFRAIVQMLQTNPSSYRSFGVYWWPIKAMLKRAGYDRTQLYMLGGYQDPETAAMVPALDADGTIRAAMAEYQFNTIYPSSDGRVENDDGELVTIADDDAAL